MKYMKKLGWAKLLIIIVAIIALLAGTAAYLVRRTYMNHLQPVSGDQTVHLITIPLGSTVSEIADTLHTKKLIRSDWAFEWYVRSHDLRDKLQAGTYALRPSDSITKIVDDLTRGFIATTLITIAPEKRLDEIRQDLINSGFSPESVDAALEPGQYEAHPALVDKPKGASLEGYLYPESFQKTDTTTPHQIVELSLDEMQKRLTPTVRAGFVKQGLTPHEGIILASIVEREVPTIEDRQQAAQVFLLRLKEGINLESNATASYGAVLAGQPPSQSFDSEYNTYIYAGLTPTPISNVSESSLNAVAFPADTVWLYFVSGDDFKTYFSRTLDEHETLVRMHCKKRCRI